MNPLAPLHGYDRFLGWLLPGIAALTPLIVFFPLTPPEQQGYFFIIATLLAAASLGVAWMMGWRALPMGVTLPALLALLVGVSAAISIARSAQPLFSLQKAMLPLCGFIFLGLIAQHPRRQAVLRRMTAVLAAIASLLAVYGILQYFDIEFLRYSERVEKNKIIATIGHPNFLGSVLGPMLFLILSLMFGWRHRWGRWIVAGLILLILFCIALARTRAVWLGVAFGTLILMLMALRYALRHQQSMQVVGGLIVGVVGEIIALGVLIAIVLPAIDRPIDLVERIMSDYEIKSRLYYWNAAIDLGQQHPWFGIGYAMFDPSFWNYALEQQQSPMGPFYYDVLPAIAGNTPEHVHNEYLEIFTEQGYFGLVSLIAFLFFFLYFGSLRVMRIAEPREALRMLCVYAALTMAMIDAMFGFPWRLPVSLIVFVVVLGWLYDMLYPQNPEDPSLPRFA